MDTNNDYIEGLRLYMKHFGYKTEEEAIASIKKELDKIKPRVMGTMTIYKVKFTTKSHRHLVGKTGSLVTQTAINATLNIEGNNYLFHWIDLEKWGEFPV